MKDEIDRRDLNAGDKLLRIIWKLKTQHYSPSYDYPRDDYYRLIADLCKNYLEVYEDFVNENRETNDK